MGEGVAAAGFGVDRRDEDWDGTEESGRPVARLVAARLSEGGTSQNRRSRDRVFPPFLFLW